MFGFFSEIHFLLSFWSACCLSFFEYFWAIVYLAYFSSALYSASYWNLYFVRNCSICFFAFFIICSDGGLGQNLSSLHLTSISCSFNESKKISFLAPSALSRSDSSMFIPVLWASLMVWSCWYWHSPNSSSSGHCYS